MEADGVLPLPVSSHTPTISAAEELALEELREKRRVLEAKWAEEGEYYTVRRGQNFCVAALRASRTKLFLTASLTALAAFPRCAERDRVRVATTMDG